MGYVKTIELMLDKINMSTRISFNTFWASSHRPMAPPPSCSTPPDSCGGYTRSPKYWMDHVEDHWYHWFNVRYSWYEYPDIFQYILYIDRWHGRRVVALCQIPVEYILAVWHIGWILLKLTHTIDIKLIWVPGYLSIHPSHRPTAQPPSCNTQLDSCGVYTGCLTYWMDYVKLNDKIH